MKRSDWVFLGAFLCGSQIGTWFAVACTVGLFVAACCFERQERKVNQ